MVTTTSGPPFSGSTNEDTVTSTVKKDRFGAGDIIREGEDLNATETTGRSFEALSRDGRGAVLQAWFHGSRRRRPHGKVEGSPSPFSSDDFSALLIGRRARSWDPYSKCYLTHQTCQGLPSCPNAERTEEPIWSQYSGGQIYTIC